MDNIPGGSWGFFIGGDDMTKPSPADILQWNIENRPSVWAQYYTKLRGKPSNYGT
jgi:hypothetical protein